MKTIDLDELKEQIDAINTAVDKIAESGITYRALYLLVQAASPAVRGKKIPIKMIEAVFGGFEGLKEYVFEGDDDEDQD